MQHAATIMWLVSDIARTYQNDVIPVIAPLICWTHGFVLKAFMNSETARGKGLLDAHFSIAMRQVQKFEETKGDVTTHEELVKALHHDGGIRKCAAESFCFSPDGTI